MDYIDVIIRKKTKKYKNELFYLHLIREKKKWWVLRDSNPRPSPCKGDALTN